MDGWKVKGWSGDESKARGDALDDAGGVDEPASTGRDRVPQGREQDPAGEARHMSSENPCVAGSGAWARLGLALMRLRQLRSESHAEEKRERAELDCAGRVGTLTPSLLEATVVLSDSAVGLLLS